MGMFDNISVSDKLPVNQEMIDCGMDINNHGFQTKDLHCSLGNYYIQGGRLFEEKYKINEWVDDAEGFGHMKREEPHLVDMNHHGKINFYDFQSDENWDYWTEYEATFTHGVVEKIELIKFKKTDNTAKNNVLKELIEDSMEAQKKWYNRYFFYTVQWAWFRNKLRSGLYWLEQKSQWLRFHLP